MESRWEDIDFQAQTISISRAVVQISHVEIQVGPKRLPVAVAASTSGRMFSLFSGNSGRTGQHMHLPLAVLCKAKPAGPHNPSNAGVAEYRIPQKYGFEGLHLHQLRHTSVTLAITNGADIASTLQEAGPQQSSHHPGIYTHPNQDAIRKAGNIARDAIRKASKNQRHSGGHLES